MWLQLLCLPHTCKEVYAVLRHCIMLSVWLKAGVCVRVCVHARLCVQEQGFLGYLYNV